jgi:very-short-patch-repair endonuclease
MKYSTQLLAKSKYVRVAPHYFALRDEWYELTIEAQHLDMCACVTKRRKHLMLTGQSAAAVLGIARTSPYEMRPHCLTEKIKGSDFVHWHHGPLDPAARIIGRFLVVGPMQAIFDMAKYDSPESLLVSINDCLHKKFFTKKEFANEIEKRHGMINRKLLLRLLRFATAKCESPLETIAWIALYKSRLSMPQQQVNISDDRELVGRVDMYWSLRGRILILELDGWSKYKMGDDFKKEKRREDHLRGMGFEVVRAEWKDVRNGKLVQMMIEKGIPPRRDFVGTFPEK